MKKVIAAIAAIGLAGGLALVGAQSASAHTPNASVSCTTASVSLTSYDKTATAKIVVDGVTKKDGTFNGSLVTSYPLSGNKEHSLSVDVISKDGAQFNYHFAQTTTGCYVDKTPTAVTMTFPTPTPPTCDVPGSLTIPGSRGQNGSYEQNGYRLFVSPEYTGPGDYTITGQKIGPNGQPGYPNGTTTTPASGTQVKVTVLPATGYQTTDSTAPCFTEVVKPLIQSWIPESVCLKNNDAKDARVAAFVLDNTGSNVAVDYTINGEVYTAAAGEAKHVENLPVPDAGKTFTVTAGDQTWTFDAPANTDCTKGKPPVKVYSVLGEKQVNCDTKTVTQTRTEYTIDSIYDEETDEWIAQGPVVTGTSTDTRDATEQDCPTPPVVVPPTDEPTSPTTEPTPPTTTEPKPPVTHKPTPVVKHAASSHSSATPTAKAEPLAFTGTDDGQRNLILGSGGLILLAGLILAIAARVRARRN